MSNIEKLMIDRVKCDGEWYRVKGVFRAFKIGGEPGDIGFEALGDDGYMRQIYEPDIEEFDYQSDNGKGELLTSDIIAKKLGISEEELKDQIRDGEIPNIKKLTRQEWRMFEKDLEEFIRDNK